MSLFVMADLHLSSDGTKSMEIFGPRWKDYIQKIEKNWRAVVSPEDTVIVPGDISWSLKLEDTLEDFRFLESLPGTKLIGKGNHDFWWSTASKMAAYFAENHIDHQQGQKIRHRVVAAAFKFKQRTEFSLQADTSARKNAEHRRRIG